MYNEAQRRLDFAVFIGWKILVTGNVTICRTAAGVPRGILPLVQMLLNWKDKMARFKACPGWRGPDCILFHYGKMKGITIINAALQFRNIEGDHPLRDSQKAHLVSLNGLVFPKVVPSWHCHNLFISCLRLARNYWREGKHGTMNICSNVKFQKDWKHMIPAWRGVPVHCGRASKIQLRQERRSRDDARSGDAPVNGAISNTIQD